MSNIKKLLKIKQKTFTSKDLSKILDIQNKSTLKMTTKRYVDKGILYRIKNGLFSLHDPLDINKQYLYQKLIKDFCYLSCESILVQKGIIFQKIYHHTFVGTRNRKIQYLDDSILVRQMNSLFLLNSTGIYKDNQGLLKADTERAVADILYYNPNYYFDNFKQINFSKVKRYQKQIRYA